MSHEKCGCIGVSYIAEENITTKQCFRSWRTWQWFVAIRQTSDLAVFIIAVKNPRKRFRLMDPHFLTINWFLTLSSYTCPTFELGFPWFISSVAPPQSQKYGDSDQLFFCYRFFFFTVLVEYNNGELVFRANGDNCDLQRPVSVIWPVSVKYIFESGSMALHVKWVTCVTSMSCFCFRLSVAWFISVGNSGVCVESVSPLFYVHSSSTLFQSTCHNQ